MAEPKTYTSASNPALQTTIADPENITRDECLALAKLGHEAWNAWRREFPVSGCFPYIQNNADFSRFDFKDKQIDFAFFEFGDNASFSEAHFAKRCKFEAVRFGEHASFERAVFSQGVSFIGAQFDTWVSFREVQFAGDTYFEGAQFANFAGFQGALFGGGFTLFDGAQFGAWCSFDGAQFFNDLASFKAKSWIELMDFYGKEFQTRKDWAIRKNIAPNEFLEISFVGVEFLCAISFADRHFKDAISFGRNLLEADVLRVAHKRDGDLKRDGNGVEIIERTKQLRNANSIFECAPNFHGCKFHQDTSFEGAIFPKAKGSEEAARAYRTLKLAFSQQQATREEQQFFRLEMAEEALMLRKSASWLDRGRYWLGYAPYSAFSDYGFSVLRPVALFFCILAAFAAIYAQQAGLTLNWNENSHGAALLQFAAAHALPGLEKLADPAALQLFGEISGVKGAANYGLGTVIALLFHKAFSLLALFLAGLALRNWFKMK